jgi:hypothetical protein
MRSFIVNRWNAVALVCASAIVFVSQAAATAYDLGPVTTGVSGQVTEALTVGLPIMGSLVALGIGIRLIRRFFHA